MAWDGAGSLYALGARLTRLDASGAPLVGANNAYVSDALVQVQPSLEYEEGKEVAQPNGAGLLCVTYRAPDTLKRGTIKGLRWCTPDPNVLNFLTGGPVIKGGGTNEVQSVSITGTPTGGTFTLTFSGQTTAAVAYNATATDVKTALEALSNIDPGDVTTAGGPLPGSAVTVTFTGQYAGTDVAQMTATSSLTGGTTPTASVSTTTGGSGGTTTGWRAPATGVDPLPNGVGLEFFTRAILQGAFAATRPYLHWVFGRAYVRPSEDWTMGAEDVFLPEFEGYCNQNPSFGDGPVADVLFATDRVWQFNRVTTIPTLAPGFVTVTA